MLPRPAEPQSRKRAEKLEITNSLYNSGNAPKGDPGRRTSPLVQRLPTKRVVGGANTSASCLRPAAVSPGSSNRGSRSDLDPASTWRATECHNSRKLRNLQAAGQRPGDGFGQNGSCRARPLYGVIPSGRSVRSHGDPASLMSGHDSFTERALQIMAAPRGLLRSPGGLLLMIALPMITGRGPARSASGFRWKPCVHWLCKAQ